MNKRFIQSIAAVICAAGLVYMLIILRKDGTLLAIWEALRSSSFGGFPL